MLQIDASNVLGLGARRLAERLLPALQKAVGEIEVRYPPQSAAPRSLLRLLSCLKRDPGAEPLLVLGDIPLRHCGRQIVFIQNAHLIPGSETPSAVQHIKNRISRYLFARNLRFADALIVQTEHMQFALEQHYPEVAGRVTIARQPAVCVKGAARREWRGGRLRLCYPAAAYPHKNHALLTAAMRMPGAVDLVEEIATTHDVERSLEGVAAIYSAADALVFPSLTESYGLPLVEAMTVGMPIVAADRPYARELCGATGIYFDPYSPANFLRALHDLRSRLDAGWVPDWSAQLAEMPQNWADAAGQFLRVIQQVQAPSSATRCRPQKRRDAGTRRGLALYR